MSIQIDGTSGISGVDGSATTPALQGTDTNTGISFGTDTVNVVTGGTTRATVDANGDFSVNTDAIFVDASTGRVGIGTTSPGAPLDIQSNSGAEAVYIRAHSSPEIGQMHFRNNANSASFFRISAESGSTELNAIGSSYLSFVTNASERMRITSTGDLRFNSGYGSVATAYGVRAWVNFNGSGTLSVNSSGGVGSVSDQGTGYYGINFSFTMPDNDYATSLADDQYGNIGVDGNPGTAQIFIRSRNTSFSSADASNVSVIIVR